jgi:FkbM family methyltransferase
VSRHLIRLWKSIRTSGMLNGSVAFYYYAYYRIFQHKKQSRRKVFIGEVRRPVWIRPGLSDWIVMERIFMDAEYDPISRDHDDRMNSMQQNIIASGGVPLIVDCGANIGLSSIWLAERFPDALIISIEPEESNFEILEMNAKNFPNIVPVHAAISSRSSFVRLYNSGDAPWAWRTEELDNGGLATVTMQQICNLYKDHTLMVVKIDIEGFEVNVLNDNVAWIDRLPLLIFEMHDWMIPWSGSGHSFFSSLSRDKRDYLIHGENVFAYSHRALQPL